MGAVTGIAYARSTRNFWSVCTKIGPGCDGCYAEASSRRIRGLDPETGEAANWGPGRPRIWHGPNAEKDLRKWNDLCRLERGGGKPAKKGRPAIKCFTEGWSQPGFWPVFINAEALGKEVVGIDTTPKDAVWIQEPNGERWVHWNPLTNADQRWECMEFLLRYDGSLMFDSDGNNDWDTWDGMHRIYMKCPAAEFPARLVAEIRRRDGSS